MRQGRQVMLTGNSLQTVPTGGPVMLAFDGRPTAGIRG